MDFQQNLYYGIGQLAYAVAKADGKVQQEEKNRLHRVVIEELKKHSSDFDISEIIFDILNKDKKDFITTYESGIRALKLSSHLIDPKMEKVILHTLQKVAASFPPVSIEEALIFKKIKADLEMIKTSKNQSSC